MMHTVVVWLLLAASALSCTAQTLVHFTPTDSFFDLDAPVAAGFAYAFRAPVIQQYTTKSRNPNELQTQLNTAKFTEAIKPAVKLSKSLASRGQKRHSIVPVYHSKPTHRNVKMNVHNEAIYPEILKTQYHSQDELGQYAFGYVHGDAAHHEERTLNGGVTGSYSYYDDLGQRQSTRYIADSKGFRVEATNLHNFLPVPVAQTPEVLAATEAHLQAVKKEKSRKLLGGKYVHVGISDTPEVLAARDAHLRAYDEIKRAHQKRWRRSAYRNYGNTHGHRSAYSGSSSFHNPAPYASNIHNIHVPVTPTPEVQAATYQHLSALNAAHKYGGNINVGIPDTPEVAAAKAAHLQAYQYIAQDHAKRW